MAVPKLSVAKVSSESSDLPEYMPDVDIVFLLFLAFFSLLCSLFRLRECLRSVKGLGVWFFVATERQ